MTECDQFQLDRLKFRSLINNGRFDSLSKSQVPSLDRTSFFHKVVNSNLNPLSWDELACYLEIASNNQIFYPFTSIQQYFELNLPTDPDNLHSMFWIASTFNKVWTQTFGPYTETYSLNLLEQSIRATLKNNISNFYPILVMIALYYHESVLRKWALFLLDVWNDITFVKKLLPESPYLQLENMVVHLVFQIKANITNQTQFKHLDKRMVATKMKGYQDQLLNFREKANKISNYFSDIKKLLIRMVIIGFMVKHFQKSKRIDFKFKNFGSNADNLFTVQMINDKQLQFEGQVDGQVRKGFYDVVNSKSIVDFFAMQLGTNWETISVISNAPIVSRVGSVFHHNNIYVVTFSYNELWNLANSEWFEIFYKARDEIKNLFNNEKLLQSIQMMY